MEVILNKEFLQNENWCEVEKFVDDLLLILEDKQKIFSEDDFKTIYNKLCQNITKIEYHIEINNMAIKNINTKIHNDYSNQITHIEGKNQNIDIDRIIEKLIISKNINEKSEKLYKIFSKYANVLSQFLSRSHEIELITQKLLNEKDKLKCKSCKTGEPKICENCCEEDINSVSRSSNFKAKNPNEEKMRTIYT